MVVAPVAGVKKVWRTGITLLYIRQAAYSEQCGKANFIKTKPSLIRRVFIFIRDNYLLIGIPTETLKVRYLFLSFSVLLLCVELILASPKP